MNKNFIYHIANWFRFREYRRVYFHRNSRIRRSKTAQFVFDDVAYLNLGYDFNEIYDKSCLLVLRANSRIHVKGVFKVFSGSVININEGANLILGSGYINMNSRIDCFQHIEIGNNVVISENVIIRDSDNHVLEYEDQSCSNPTSPIFIGNNVWIGLNVVILKGVTIGDNSVIAAGSVVVSDVPTKCLAGGVPAKVIRENISWK